MQRATRMHIPLLVHVSSKSPIRVLSELTCVRMPYGAIKPQSPMSVSAHFYGMAYGIRQEACLNPPHPDKGNGGRAPCMGFCEHQFVCL